MTEAEDPPDDTTDGKPRRRKAPQAFRTISEVADDLHVPQHVLRFWETRFPQVKPLKRGGGRRYYRPEDVALLKRVADLLYVQGYTIKGVQRLLREGGGTLADDLPPPRAEDADDDDMPPLPLLGVAPAPRPLAKSCEHLAEQEAARLRSVLTSTLAELEHLRDLLRAGPSPRGLPLPAEPD